MEPLIRLEEALFLGRARTRELYRRYVNPGLAALLGSVGFDRRYVRASGVSVWDAEGNEYWDFLGGYGAVNQGHNHPRIVAALEAVREAPNLLQASLSSLVAAVAHNLAQITPGDLSRTFFCNSGAEAVEGALKLARAATRKRRILYAQGSFHGKSFGALSVTGRSKYQDPFRPLLPETYAVPYGDLDALEGALRRRDVAAVILEPIQGEGGVIVPPEGYLRGVQELCRRYEALLILDEIQTGFGRTGKLFACEWEGVTPDILCLAKSLGGGVMPVGAFVTTPQVWDRAYGGMERALLHTSTFGGNARAMAVALASIEVVVEENLAEKARLRGEQALAGLRAIQRQFPSMIREVRGRGLLIGVEFEKPTRGWAERLTGGLVNRAAAEYGASLVAAQLLDRYRIITAYTLNNPNVIRFEPPLVVTEEQVRRTLNAVRAVLSEHRSFFSLAAGAVRSALGERIRRG
ncbi:MAG: aspartate aminotransferase family protein [Bacillota bacterium]|nr:aspartate aminotransferase family protein [Bacillota bacterium]